MLENITFPEPVISVAIEPKTTADQDKMGEALRKLSEEDPTFRVHSDENTGQTIIRGMGELHLDVLVDRMLREFRVQANVGRPRVSYRETITRPVLKVNYRYVKQIRRTRPVWACGVQHGTRWSGAMGLSLRIKSLADPSRGIYSRGGKRCHEAAESGVLAGYPVTDLKVHLIDGSYHEVDSNEMAFKMAAILAFKEGMRTRQHRYCWSRS